MLAAEHNGGMGRNSRFTHALGAEINRRIADGLPLMTVCEQIGVHVTTVRRWLREGETEELAQFRSDHARARLEQAQTLFDQIIPIADKSHRVLPSGTVVPVDPQRAKLQVDARRFVVGRLDPDRFADRVEHRHSGSVEITGMDRDACLARLQELAERGVPIPRALLTAPVDVQDAEFEDTHPGADLI